MNVPENTFWQLETKKSLECCKDFLPLSYKFVLNVSI